MLTDKKKHNKFISDRRSLDDATEEMIGYTRDFLGIKTIFSEPVKSCKYGLLGACCKQCALGPCRNEGACGADADTIVARNLLMMVGRGVACHASHSLHVASIMLNNLNGENYKIKEPEKLKSIATKLKLDISQKNESLILQVASIAVSDILSDKTCMDFLSYCPNDVVENLRYFEIIPSSVCRELLKEKHATSMGTMSDPTSLILHAIRLGVADILSLIIGSELQDVLLGTPKLVQSNIGFNALNKDKVNLVIHGHFPIFAERIIEISKNSEFIEMAKVSGATGINIVGCCCTGNEVVMRHGVPLAGSNLQQELIIATGLVEAFVVDVQCIHPNIINVAKYFHTKIITTMEDAKILDADYMPFEEKYPNKAAEKIIKTAINNFKRRSKFTYLPRKQSKELIAGFSTETCLKMFADINPKDHLKPLIDNIISGNIYGIVLLAGCTSPNIIADTNHVTIAKNLIKQNVLVVATGCAAQACARAGLMSTDAACLYAGNKLKNILALLGATTKIIEFLPPVWHFGSCTDNGRVIIFISAIAEKLGVRIRDLPIAASAAEWVAEKATSIGMGALAFGITVHLGTVPPILGSPKVINLLTQKSEEMFGGKFIIEVDPEKASQLILEEIKKKRKEQGMSES